MGTPFRYSWPTMAILWKHKNGRYYVLWRDQGKPRQKSFKTTDKRVATRLFNNFQRDLIAGKIKPISIGIRQTLFPFVDEFLEHLSFNPNIQISTYRVYETALEKAKSCWGDKPLSHLSIRDMDRLLTDMSRSGLKPTTINKNYRHIKASIKKGFKWYKIKSDIDFPPQLREQTQARYFSVEQLRNLLSVINDREFADLCLFSAYTGLRSGETVRLTWQDVDNPGGYLRIDSRQKNKTESRIWINKSARSILDCQKKRSLHLKIFRFNTTNWISQKFKSYARSAGLSWARFHDLRHTFGSHLAMAGENPQTIAELMRHKSLASTAIYMHLSPAHLRQASEKLNYGLIPVGRNKSKEIKK